MKLLTVVIPCYNSQEYMEKCIDSILPGGSDVEIIIVNDGSIDDTKKIAQDYEKKHPNIIKAIHQKNGGHGHAVNTGIKNASGKYLKVVDSDDWLDAIALKKVIIRLKELDENNENCDMFVCNFVYEKQGVKRKKVMKYNGIIPQERLVTWDDIGAFPKGQYILMHSIIYNMEVLKSSGIELPKHTFYVDNLFVYLPLPYVNTVYYLDVDLYRYFIGRESQSVNEKNMIKNIDQQLLVNKIMLDRIDLDSVSQKSKRTYMFNHLEIITVVSSIMLIRSKTREALSKKNELWRHIKFVNPSLYQKLIRSPLGATVNLPTSLGRQVSCAVYKLARKLYGFN